MDDGLQPGRPQVFVSLYDEGLIYRDYFLVNRCPQLPDRALRHRDRAQGRRRASSGTSATRCRGLGRVRRRGHHAARDHARRHGRGRPSGRRALHAPASARGSSCRSRTGPSRSSPTSASTASSAPGAVKVTPAHDPVDFEIGKKHGLEQIIVIDGTGKMTEAAGPDFAGLDRFAAAGQGRRGPQRAGPARQDRGPRPRRRPLLPLQDRHRAAPLLAVVRADQAAGRRGHPRRRGRRDRVHPGELGQDLLRLDVQHPRLVHLAPALVGPPHPGLVLPGLRPDHGGHGGRRRSAPSAAAAARPGRGRPRHLVLLRPVALLHPRLAGRDRGPARRSIRPT